MSQSTLDDDELLGEAASEIREDVETHLDAARAELPDAAAVWEVDSENTLGVLNALKSSLDVGEAPEHLRNARKWFMVGQRADAFEDSDSLEAEIDDLAGLIETVEAAREGVNDLASTVPELRGSLEEFETSEDDDGENAETAADTEDEE